MILEYIANAVMILCLVALDFIPLKSGFDLAKEGYIKYAILSFTCALVIVPFTFVYLAGNPSNIFF